MNSLCLATVFLQNLQKLLQASGLVDGGGSRQGARDRLREMPAARLLVGFRPTGDSRLDARLAHRQGRPDITG